MIADCVKLAKKHETETRSAEMFPLNISIFWWKREPKAILQVFSVEVVYIVAAQRLHLWSRVTDETPAVSKSDVGIFQIIQKFVEPKYELKTHVDVIESLPSLMECTQTFSFLGGNILIFDSELNISSHVFITVQRQTLCWNSLSQYKTTQGILRLETCVTERNDTKC